MSDTEINNKEIVRTLCKYLNDRDPARIASLIAEDGQWIIAGNPDTFSFAGRYDKLGIEKLLEGFLGTFSSFEFNVISIIAEEDRVAVEANSQGQGQNLKSYVNQYLMLYRLREGQVVEVKEFFDPFAVLAYTQ